MTKSNYDTLNTKQEEIGGAFYSLVEGQDTQEMNEDANSLHNLQDSDGPTDGVADDDDSVTEVMCATPASPEKSISGDISDDEISGISSNLKEPIKISHIDLKRKNPLKHTGRVDNFRKGTFLLPGFVNFR